MAQRYVYSYFGKSHLYDIWNGGKRDTNIINLINTFLLKAGLSTIPHNLPLQIYNTNLYQPTYNMSMCTRISLGGKNDRF